MYVVCQIFVLPSTGFEPTPLLHCSTIRLLSIYVGVHVCVCEPLIGVCVYV